MGKSSPCHNGTAGAVTPAVHLILQGKGGIGKSVVASWLVEFLASRGQPVCAIDADPVNRSLGQYRALQAEKLDLVNPAGLIERCRFDRLIDRFVSESGVFVVDSGATVFLPFWSYIIEAEILRVLSEAGRRVYLHVPISGGDMLQDTLLGFQTLAVGASGQSIVLWINEYFGPVAREGKAFHQMQVYLENESKVVASIGLPQRSPDTFGETVRLMRERKMTFQEATESDDFMLVQRSRLHIVRRDLFEQLEAAPFA